MKLFIDTANVKDIKEANDMGGYLRGYYKSDTDSKRRHKDKRYIDIYCRSGFTGCKSRGDLCKSLPWKTG
jgi:hypothetical protein